MTTIVGLLLCFASQQWRPHPEWGSEPPVAPYTTDSLPGDSVLLDDMVFPLIGPCRYSDDYGEMRSGFRHTGIDIDAPKMTPIVAPFSGRIGFKPDTFWIYGDNGWAMMGTHLNDDDPGTSDHSAGKDYMFAPYLVPGQHVTQGQFIGYVGMSGDATGPHLHFEIYVPGWQAAAERIRDAYPSLRAAHVLHKPIAPPELLQPAPPPGSTLFEGCVRGVNSESKTINLILASKEGPDGSVTAVTWVRYLSFPIADAVAERVGGWEALAKLPDTALVNLIVPNNSTVNGSPVSSATLGAAPSFPDAPSSRAPTGLRKPPAPMRPKVQGVEVLEDWTNGVKDWKGKGSFRTAAILMPMAAKSTIVATSQRVLWMDEGWGRSTLVTRLDGIHSDIVAELGGSGAGPDIMTVQRPDGHGGWHDVATAQAPSSKALQMVDVSVASLKGPIQIVLITEHGWMMVGSITYEDR